MKKRPTPSLGSATEALSRCRIFCARLILNFDSLSKFLEDKDRSELDRYKTAVLHDLLDQSRDLINSLSLQLGLLDDFVMHPTIDEAKAASGTASAAFVTRLLDSRSVHLRHQQYNQLNLGSIEAAGFAAVEDHCDEMTEAVRKQMQSIEVALGGISPRPRESGKRQTRWVQYRPILIRHPKYGEFVANTMIRQVLTNTGHWVDDPEFRFYRNGVLLDDIDNIDVLDD